MKKLITSAILATLLAGGAQADCNNMNITLDNRANGTLEIYKAQVKVKGGIWKNLSNFSSTSLFDAGGRLVRNYAISDLRGVEIPRDQELRLTNNSPFKCDARRRYKVEFKCGNGKVLTNEYPGSNSWTTRKNPTIKLGARCS